MSDFDLMLDVQSGYFSPDDPIPLCSQCGNQIQTSYELASGLCWICEKPEPQEKEHDT